MARQTISSPVLFQIFTHRLFYSSGQGRDSLPAAYSQLGLTTDASVEEVKGAYRRLALRCHPDLNKKDGQEFVRITAAYRRIMSKNTMEVPSKSSGGRYHGPVIYAQHPHPRFTPRAATVWGVGLAMGCAFFGAVLLWARAELVQGSYHRKSPSRVVEPTHDTSKRERIQALLMERTKNRDSESGS